MIDEIFEGLGSLLMGLFEGLVALLEIVWEGFCTVVEALAGLFVEDAAAVGVGLLLVTFVVLFAEVIAWCFLWLFELVMLVIERRRPKQVRKPVFWRPKPKHE